MNEWLSAEVGFSVLLTVTVAFPEYPLDGVNSPKALMLPDAPGETVQLTPVVSAFETKAEKAWEPLTLAGFGLMLTTILLLIATGTEMVELQLLL